MIGPWARLEIHLAEAANAHSYQPLSLNFLVLVPRLRSRESAQHFDVRWSGRIDFHLFQAVLQKDCVEMNLP